VAAQAVSAGLLVAAGLFAGWVLRRHGLDALAGAATAAGLLAGLLQARAWRRARRAPAVRLRRAPDGGLWLESAAAAVAVQAGPATRILGPSVFLDLRASDTQARRCWLTPLDLPPGALRRLTLVLPRSGPGTGS
jgi:hypothetical protein